MTTSNDAEAAARQYAWNWFQYHAGQRQAVFRFYLILTGAVWTGYFASLRSSDTGTLPSIFGFMLILLSVLFWRLDVRSIKLIKIAEAYLKADESALSSILDRPEITLVKRADSDRKSLFPFNFVYSFRQVYRLMFIIIGLVGVGIIVVDQLGSVDKFEPGAGGSQAQHTEQGRGDLVTSCGEGAISLDVFEDALDATAPAGETFSVSDCNLPVIVPDGAKRNDLSDPEPAE